MDSCEATLYRSLEEILGPALAAAVEKSIIELVPAASICMLSQSIGKIGGEIAGSLHSTIENLASATTEKDRDRWIKVLLGLLIAGVGAYFAPILLQLIVSALGFGKGGIVAGSLASSFMETYAGFVGAGSLCATLQSVGAAGLGPGGAALASLAGAAAGWWTGSKLGETDDFFKFKENLEQLWG